MSIVRNLVKIVCCVCLTGCQALPGIASRQPTPRPESSPDANRKGDAPSATPTARGQSSEIRPIDAEGGVVHLQLSAGGLRERAGEAPPALPKPVIDLPPPETNRIPALQRELVRQLTLKIDDLRAKIQVLNAQVKARSTPPKETPVDAGKTTGGEQKLVIARIAQPPPPSAPVLAEKPAVQQVAHTEPIVPGDVPTASQREINRLITQCLSDLEKEVRELGERVRAITPPGQ
jgi:hypothetical protein